mmetsp:Transcript_4370/g.7669  ORF Transcript_4370/g.7669 Transcript_4370/m.7669 type:complete len:98 (+) Transcript_4370:452-745(+)
MRAGHLDVPLLLTTAKAIPEEETTGEAATTAAIVTAVTVTTTALRTVAVTTGAVAAATLEADKIRVAATTGGQGETTALVRTRRRHALLHPWLLCAA